jgi:hypothetical protein
MMDLVDGAFLSSSVKSLYSVGNLTNNLSLQNSSWGLITANQVGPESCIVPKD